MSFNHLADAESVSEARRPVKRSRRRLSARTRRLRRWIAVGPWVLFFITSFLFYQLTGLCDFLHDFFLEIANRLEDWSNKR